MKSWEQYSDILNPLFLRDVRRSLRSNLFASLIIISSFLLVFYSACNLFDRNYGLNGSDFFKSIYCILWICGSLFIPLMISRSFGEDKNSGEDELFSITGILPLQVIKGKFFFGMFQVLVLLFSSAPFMIASYVLSGITVFTIIFAMFLLVLGSSLFIMLGIFAGSCRVSRNAKTLIDGALFLFSVFFMIGMANWWNRGRSIDLSVPWPMLLEILISYVFYMSLLLFASIASLDFKGRNNEFPLKLIMLLYVPVSALTIYICNIKISRENFDLDYMFQALIALPAFIACCLLWGPVQAAFPYVRRKWAAIPLCFKALFYTGRGAYISWFSVYMILVISAELLIEKRCYPHFLSMFITHFTCMSGLVYLTAKYSLNLKKCSGLFISIPTIFLLFALTLIAYWLGHSRVSHFVPLLHFVAWNS